MSEGAQVSLRRPEGLCPERSTAGVTDLGSEGQVLLGKSMAQRGFLPGQTHEAGLMRNMPVGASFFG